MFPIIIGARSDCSILMLTLDFLIYSSILFWVQMLIPGSVLVTNHIFSFSLKVQNLHFFGADEKVILRPSLEI